MDDRRGRSTFAGKPLPGRSVVSQVRGEHFDRHRPIQFSVVTFQDDAHSALPDDFFNFVSAHPAEHFEMRRL
jgi:hypothetical protein